MVRKCHTLPEHNKGIVETAPPAEEIHGRFCGPRIMSSTCDATSILPRYDIRRQQTPQDGRPRWSDTSHRNCKQASQAGESPAVYHHHRRRRHLAAVAQQPSGRSCIRTCMRSKTRPRKFPVSSRQCARQGLAVFTVRESTRMP